MHFIEVLSDLCKSSPHPIIAIDGPAGGGKTTLAQDLAISLGLASQVIHMDDLYNGWDLALSAQLTEKLLAIIQAHKSSKQLIFDRYNWKTSQYGETVTLQPRDLLILEGVGSGQREVREFLSALIWMEIDPLQGLERVITRDGKEIQAFMQKWLETQENHFFVQSTHDAADFVITT